MNVAEARYVGSKRHQHLRSPHGTDYLLGRHASDPEASWVAVEAVEDARWLADQPAIEVRWKPLGRLKAATGDAADALTDWSYRQKQKLVAELDLDIAGNAPEEEMDEALQAVLDDIERGNL